MLKVMIADDEERICQLIKALVDWKSLDMEVVGIANNGLEAGQMVQNLHPDILITDIRMPGRNGLELIESVKKSVTELEIIIISGYAHFAYAQTAIKFGVGDYLLKPINKEELTSTLCKLKQRIEARKKTEQNTKQLRQKSENDIRRLQQNLLEQLQEGKGKQPGRYSDRVREGAEPVGGKSRKTLHPAPYRASWRFLYRIPELCGGETGADPACTAGLPESVGKRTGDLWRSDIYGGIGMCCAEAGGTERVIPGDDSHHRRAIDQGDRKAV